MAISNDTLMTRAQIGLAIFYGLIFVGMFTFMALFWDHLSKFDVGLITMFATGAMTQSGNANTFFFVHRRTPNDVDQTTASPPSAPVVNSPSVEK